MGILDAPAPSRALAAVKAPVTTPSGFTWTTHPLVGHLFVDQHGTFSSDLDPTTLKAPAGVAYYVDCVNGSDANDGLSLGTALKSMFVAAAKADIGTMYVVGYGPTNPYVRSRGFNGFTGTTKNLNIIGIGSAVPYITTHDVVAWTLTAGATYTYQTTRSSVSRVVDMINAANDTDGVEYTNVASQALVEATPASWFQSGSTLYIHGRANRVPDAYMWPLLSVVNFRNTGDFTTYLENLKLFGGSEVIKVSGATSAGGMLVCNNVEAHYSQFTVGNNIAVNGCDSVMVNCDWSFSGMDGIGYHVLNGKVNRAVEIGCRGVSCGSTGTDQCSTIHDGGKIIRVSCTYRVATGAVVADVNDLTESWNLGVIADAGAAGYSFKFGNDAGSVKAWLHGCDGRGSKWAVYSFGTAVVKARGGRFERANVTLASY